MLKDLALKVFRNAGVRKAFYALLVAIAAALGYNALPGCSPAQISQANSAVDQIQAEGERLQAEANALIVCLGDVRETYNLDQPEQLSPAEAPQLQASIMACLKPAQADAGAR